MVEWLPYKQYVSGSSPDVPIKKKKYLINRLYVGIIKELI